MWVKQKETLINLDFVEEIKIYWKTIALCKGNKVIAELEYDNPKEAEHRFWELGQKLTN